MRPLQPNDISGAGRSLDGGVPMVDRMIRDSLDYWAGEYHVDGFRFDLMGAFRFVNVAAWGEYLRLRGSLNAKLNSAMYAVPTWGSPVGDGAIRTRTGLPEAVMVRPCNTPC